MLGSRSTGRQSNTTRELGSSWLLANKGERGKKKLAEKLDGTMYTVVSVNDTTHTNKIRSHSGNIKALTVTETVS